MANVVSKLEAVLTLDNKQFMSSLKQSSRAITAFSRSLDKVNSKLNKLSVTIKSNIGASLGSTTTKLNTFNTSMVTAQKNAGTFNKAAQAAFGVQAMSNFARGTSKVTSGVNSLGKASEKTADGMDALSIAGAAAFGARRGTASQERLFRGMSEASLKMQKKNLEFLDKIQKSSGNTAFTGVSDAIKETDRALTAVKAPAVKATKSIGLFSSALNKLKTPAGGATAVIAIAAAVATLGLSLGKLAKEIDNVERGFERLGGDETLLNNLKESTGNVISDLDLMKKANLAVNLGLDKSQLPDYFKFATIRAAETGMAVDALVESIVTGIGRESKMVIDNLGISQTRLNAKIKETGDFATAVSAIIKEEMASVGITVAEVTSGVSKLGTSLVNLWDNIADINFWDGFDDVAGELAKIVDLTDDWFDKLAAITMLGDGGIVDARWLDLAELDALIGALATQQKIRDEAFAEWNRVKDVVGGEYGAAAWAGEYDKALQNIENISQALIDWGNKDKDLSKSLLGNLRDAKDIYDKLAEAAKTPEEVKKWSDASAAVEQYIRSLTKAKEIKEKLVKVKEEPISKKVIDVEKWSPSGLIDQLESTVDLLEQELSTLTDILDIKKQLARIDAAQAILDHVKSTDKKGYVPTLEGNIESLERLQNLTFDSAEWKAYQKEIENTTRLLEEFTGVSDDAATSTMGFYEAIVYLIEGALVDFVNSLADVAEEMGRVFAEGEGFDGDFLLKTFGDFLKSMGRLMASYGALLIAYGITQDRMEKPSTPAEKIIAGAALVAIGVAMAGVGSAISSSAGGAPGSGGSGGGNGAYSPGYYDYNNQVIFKIEGDDLVGTLQRNTSKSTYNGF